MYSDHIGTSDSKHYKGIANAIRTSFGGLFEIDGDVYNPEEMPNMILEAFKYEYNSGHKEGYEKGHLDGWEAGRAEGGYDEGWSDGYDAGYDACEDQNFESWFQEGKQAERNAFWNLYQENGNRTDYETGYAGRGWTNNTFNPIYNMQPTTAYMMFRQTRISGDLVEILANLGVTLDFSKCPSMLYTFSYMPSITRVGVVNLTKLLNASSANYLFQGSSKLKKIDEIVLPSSRVYFTSAFEGCTALEDVAFSGGEIQYSISFADCKNLSKASITNVMAQLSATASLSVTFSETAVNKAFETSVGENDGSTSAEWTALKASVTSVNPNVTISLDI